MGITFKDNSAAVKAALTAAVESYLYEAGGELQGATMRNSRVDTGQTKDGGIVYADCEKVKDKYRVLIGADFIITFYVDGLALDEEHRYRVMFHELLHVGFDAENDHRWIVPHNIQDFKACIDRWGSDWVN